MMAVLFLQIPCKCSHKEEARRFIPFPIELPSVTFPIQLPLSENFSTTLGVLSKVSLPPTSLIIKDFN
jgi:hypothetical protein